MAVLGRRDKAGKITEWPDQFPDGRFFSRSLYPTASTVPIESRSADFYVLRPGQKPLSKDAALALRESSKKKAPNDAK